MAVLVSAGQASDLTFLVPLLDGVQVSRAWKGRPGKRPTSLRMDRVYGAGVYRRALWARGIRCICAEP